MEKGICGRSEGPDGVSALKFKGRRVHVTASLGTTFRAAMEIDGDKVIIRGDGGGRVFRRRADTLDAGKGITFITPRALGPSARSVRRPT